MLLIAQKSAASLGPKPQFLMASIWHLFEDACAFARLRAKHVPPPSMGFLHLPANIRIQINANIFNSSPENKTSMKEPSMDPSIDPVNAFSLS